MVNLAYKYSYFGYRFGAMDLCVVQYHRLCYPMYKCERRLSCRASLLVGASLSSRVSPQPKRGKIYRFPKIFFGKTAAVLAYIYLFLNFASGSMVVNACRSTVENGSNDQNLCVTEAYKTQPVCTVRTLEIEESQRSR